MKNFSFVIVDDSDNFRGLIVEILRDPFKGSSFFQFPDGLGAKEWLVESCKKNVIVITDLEMPNLAGDGLVRFMKESPDLRGVPVVMISGYIGIREIAELYGCRFLPKPFKPGELMEIIHEFTNTNTK